MAAVARWPGALVPYDFASDVREHERALIEAALREWARNTRAKFVPRSGHESDFVRFRVDTAGHSTIGRGGGEQIISLPNGFGLGLVLHETGHALGLRHEHTRPDRDIWLKVHVANARAGKASELTALEPRADLARLYDYGSVMQYPMNVFAKPGLITLEPIREVPEGVVIGAWSKLGRGDIESIELLYSQA